MARLCLVVVLVTAAPIMASCARAECPSPTSPTPSSIASAPPAPRAAVEASRECVIAAAALDADVLLSTLDQPRREIAVVSGSIAATWFDPDLATKEGRIRYQDNGVFRISGWAKARHSLITVHLADRAMLLDGHAWVNAAARISEWDLRRVEDRVRFRPRGPLPSVPVETPCENVRFGEPRGEYPRYEIFRAADSRPKHASGRLDVFAEPGGRLLHSVDGPQDVAAYDETRGYRYVVLSTYEAVLHGWARPEQLGDPPSPERHGRLSCCNERTTARTARLATTPAKEIRVGTIAKLTDLHVGAEPGGAAVGSIEPGLRVLPGEEKGDHVSFETYSGSGFEAPPGQRFWVARSDIRVDVVPAGRVPDEERPRQ